jgi:hypothetical protein
MKKTILLCLLPFILSACCDINLLTQDVPQNVINNFHSKYPYATKVKWEAGKYKGHLAYKACFKLEEKKMKTWYRQDGTVLKEK